MAIREDLVASAAQFLQDPNVASSPVENRIAFLQSKNLTQEEVNAALSRSSSSSSSTEPSSAPSYAPPPATPAPPQQSQLYSQYPPQYPPYAWQPPPSATPRRDWRDWFIMATVVSGVGYGLYSLSKRYIYPLVAPPTPERLEQDKKSIDDQFERAFALVDQLAKDTEALKAAEQERTEKLDTALSELETVMSDLKSANRRREDESQRARDDVQSLKDSIPRAMNTQKELTDNRLREVNAELKSLKTLISQRMNPTATSASVSNYLRPSVASSPNPAAAGSNNNGADTNGKAAVAAAVATGVDGEQADKQETRDHAAGASANRSSPFNTGIQPSKASIPAWQLAMAPKNTAPSASSPAPNGAEASGSSSQ